jgi:Transmembrane secretion effector/Cation transporter/ATPase, N-terminus
VPDLPAAYWATDASNLLIQFKSRAAGLTSQEAAVQLSISGPNILNDEKNVGPLRLLLRQYESPLLLVLNFGAVLSLILKQWTDAGMATGSWVWGIVAERYGPDRALLCTALSLAFGAAIGIWMRLPNFENLNLDPLNHFKEPSLRLDITQRSGPIMIMLDYEIEQENLTDFLEVMNLRRRIRIRDGAQRWALLRDLENPDIWTETYHVPTWVEYVQHNHRRTQADADVTNRLMLLNRSKELPRVHRMIERQTVPMDDDMPLKEI